MSVDDDEVAVYVKHCSVLCIIAQMPISGNIL